ncbi:hypothetical protein ABCS02_19885 [Microbacterium sp. X-17]|uniref:hypothetical protein n=1 Tax=Microbacterium sp. X-17 TaxID=3144404 RepID=UPI0031F5670F
MSAQLPPHVPENEPLEELESKTADELITPEEDVFRRFSDPRPTDAIGSEGGDRPVDEEKLDD